MRGHNLCFYEELTKIIPNYHQILPLISRALGSKYLVVVTVSIIKCSASELDKSIYPVRGWFVTLENVEGMIKLLFKSEMLYHVQTLFD